jgi:hypothetical protein
MQSNLLLYFGVAAEPPKKRLTENKGIITDYKHNFSFWIQLTTDALEF